MQVLLHSGPGLDGHQPMAEHLEAVITGSLGRFGERVTRVDAHLSGVEGRARFSEGSIHCKMEARLPGLDAVVVSEHGDNVHQAIEGGVRKLKRAVGVAIGKHDPRRHQALADAGRSAPSPTDPQSGQRGAGTEPA
jgi:ribosome-associated translation inhibitor RaiA